MLLLNNILKEIKDIPANRLQELYQVVHSLTPTIKQKNNLRKKILSYGGAFGDMSNKDYKDYQKHAKRTRVKLFDRNTGL